MDIYYFLLFTGMCRLFMTASTVKLFTLLNRTVFSEFFEIFLYACKKFKTQSFYYKSCTFL